MDGQNFKMWQTMCQNCSEDICNWPEDVFETLRIADISIQHQRLFEICNDWKLMDYKQIGLTEWLNKLLII